MRRPTYNDLVEAHEARETTIEEGDRVQWELEADDQGVVVDLFTSPRGHAMATVRWDDTGTESDIWLDALDLVEKAEVHGP